LASLQLPKSRLTIAGKKKSNTQEEKNMKSTHAKRHILAAPTAGFVIASASSVAAQPMTGHQGQNHQEHQGHQGHDNGVMETPAAEALVENAQTLPPIPTNLLDWMDNKDKNHIYRKRGSYNDAVYNVRSLALDLNAIAVGHAFAYEDLVRGKAKDLETKTFARINWVLNNPPRFMPNEANISSTFGRRYGVLEQLFD